jgi:succinate dehydrogenase / fumarate reductase iron-sulfur subunit
MIVGKGFAGVAVFSSMAKAMDHAQPHPFASFISENFPTVLPFPTIQDLMVDRSALDRIIAAGGYCSTGTGQAPDANAQPIGRQQALKAFDTATCIGCGACVASCRNASASLFVAAKLAHLGQLPQGQPERSTRARTMQIRMEEEGFGSCSSNLECEAVCPQEISADWISWMHREK